jgi:hypothetical protein
VLVPVSAPFASEDLPSSVPYMLRVDDHPVEVEDDRLDHGTPLCRCPP